MNQKIRIGIIGMGTIGRIHADAFSANGDDAEMVFLCDVNMEHLREMGKKYRISNLYRDYQASLQCDADAVIVCASNIRHKEIACAALRAGRHVLLEKPMAMSAAEAAEIVKAAKESGKTLQIGMVQRQRNDVQLAKKYVDDGLFGDIYHLRAVLIRRRGIPGLGGWFTTKSISGGGPLIDLGVHCLDAAMFVSGHWKPTAVSAATYSKFGNPIQNYKYINMWAEPPKIDGICDTEDYAAGFVRFDRNASMNFEFAWAANTDDESFIEILGTKGGMRIFASRNPRLLTEFNGNIADVELLVPEQKDAFQIQARKFIRACRGECPSETTGDQGLITMKLIDAIYRSAASGKEELVC